MEELLLERMNLVFQRIGEMETELQVEEFPAEYREYFLENIHFLQKVNQAYETVKAGGKVLGKENKALYELVLPENYAGTYANPAVAVKKLGKKRGQLLSFLEAELISMIEYAFTPDVEELLIREELFLEIFSICKAAFSEDHVSPSEKELEEAIYWFVFDYSDLENEKKVASMVDADYPESRFLYDIIMNSDLSDTDYLYRYGCYITENERRGAEYLNSLPEETIQLMADTYTEGYRIGFEVAGKPLEKKETVNIRYCAGFERVIRAAIVNFEKMGLRPVIYRASMSAFYRSGASRNGFYGAVANKQFDYDHREDEALYFDGNYKTRRLETMRDAYELYKEKAQKHAGPAVMEIFGEKPFEPEDKPQALRLSSEQQKKKVEYASAAGEMVNRYIPGEERSFTIIAFPVPEIGEKYEEIFDEIIKINTLDYREYEQIQSVLIDALNQAKNVHIVGKNGNRTDLVVELCKLSNPETQTIFENCVADVNIPVGEVFTSPVLKGTNGTLHVKKVYLNELSYENLEICFKDGMTVEYTCTNFEDSKACERYVMDNVLFHHKELPMGEFAIGTNTVAYMAAKKYQIADKLPILIAEKMGPHFAVGDTCYSHEEDVVLHNLDGREIVAKENEISALRKTDPSKAYFNCHTDITIPYDELGEITAICEDGREIPIISDGKFVLKGCEKLNVALAAEGIF